MAKFLPNTFNPIYPESNDKRGEIQLLNIREPEEVGENWTEEMRLDLLPVFKDSTDANIRSTPVGRQTMFRTVFTDENDIFWVQNYGDPSFLNTGGVVSANLGFFDFVSYNVRKYEDFLNGFFSDNGILTSILITKIHVIGSNIQFIQHTGNTAIFLHTYDVIFYGQESPNPYIPPAPPAPPCEQLNNYAITLNYAPTPSRGTAAVVGGNIMEVTLLPKGGGGGVQACAALFKISDPVDSFYLNIGQQFALKIEYNALISGTIIPVTILWQGITITTVNLNDTGATVYVPLSVQQASNFSFRYNFGNQAPLAGENNPTIRFSLWTDTCLIPT